MEKKTKPYVGWARVSSREQEAEGFSLEVQAEAFRKFADEHGGVVAPLYTVAETASKTKERATFREMLEYVKGHAKDIDAVLVYKMDRASRNLKDYVALEELESEYGVPLICITQPTENTPAGRMHRRMLVNMAAYYTEQQSLDVKAGMEKRVENGLFPGRAPYGYRNVRVNKRSLVEVDPHRGPHVTRIYWLYAYMVHTVSQLIDVLREEGIEYTDSKPRWPVSSLYRLLHDRSYIGDVLFRGEWHPGSHDPLVDMATWRRVQALLGDKSHSTHESVYGAGMVRCAQCGHPLCVEVKKKSTKSGDREYRYYRCTRYNIGDHPRTRVSEGQLDEQMLDMLEALRVGDERVCKWFVETLRERVRASQDESGDRLANLQRRYNLTQAQKDELIMLRLQKVVDDETYMRTMAELYERCDDLRVRIEACDRAKDENAEMAVRTFELSQHLADKWDTADIFEKRQMLEIVCLNLALDGVSLVPTWRKPFDVLVEGLLVKDGSPNEI